VIADIGGGFVMDDYVMGKELTRAQPPRLSLKGKV
jgi:hypothetical protein